MTKSDGTGEEDERRFGPGGYPRDAMARGRWVNPLLRVLGALVLSGYLMTGHPSTPAATAPAPPSDEQLAPAQMPPPLAFNKETGRLPDSVVAQDEWTSASVNDLLKTAFAAALALAWAVGGAWLGMRRARRSNPRDDAADTTAYPTHTAFDSRRAPTCERMYDETCRNISGGLNFRRRSTTSCDWPGSILTRAKHYAGSNGSRTAAIAACMT
jgi:hypothetical protein